MIQGAGIGGVTTRVQFVRVESPIIEISPLNSATCSSEYYEGEPNRTEPQMATSL